VYVAREQQWTLHTAHKDDAPVFYTKHNSLVTENQLPFYVTLALSLSEVSSETLQVI